MAVAPFTCIWQPGFSKPELAAVANHDRKISNAGFEVLNDDREVEPGVKFKDAICSLPLRLRLAQRVEGRVVELRVGARRNEKMKPEEVVEAVYRRASPARPVIYQSPIYHLTIPSSASSVDIPAITILMM